MGRTNRGRRETRLVAREREKEFVSGNGVVAAAAATAGGSMYATVFLFLYAIVFSFVLYASFLLSFANTRRFFFFSWLKLVNWGFFPPKKAKEY